MKTIKVMDWLAHDQIDEIVVSELTASMNDVAENIVRLRNMIENSGLGFVFGGDQHDLTYDLAYFDALHIVLKHFTAHNSPEREIIDKLKCGILTRH